MSSVLAKRRLIAHPDFPCPAIEAFEIELSRVGEAMLHIDYAIVGDMAALLVPAPAIPARRDELWRHTCFEAFVEDGGGYAEVNLAPSGEWAAYRFDGYRTGMRDAPVVSPPAIASAVEPGRLTVGAKINLAGLVAPGPARIGLSAVIEAKDGAKSYWALAHAEGNPDFHHHACFAIELPAPERA